MLQVNLDGAGADAQRDGDVFVLCPALHQFHYLQFPRGERRAGDAQRRGRCGNQFFFRPGASASHLTDALQQRIQLGGLANHSGGAGLQQAQRFGLRQCRAPHHRRGAEFRVPQGPEALQHRLDAEGLV